MLQGIRKIGVKTYSNYFALEKYTFYGNFPILFQEKIGKMFLQFDSFD